MSNNNKEIQQSKIDIAVLKTHLTQQRNDIVEIKIDIKSILRAVKP